ncbi:hypothetical protein NPIL_480771 [Nephila pilipes]|uniref:Uncharacterized protein n=1 Tax=Nephila pilipes TaxID=299642 RepID=A0A8X6KB66_NEPPI|nr:hypothetical protein NPIL_480771 [Nephila pilipes]
MSMKKNRPVPPPPRQQMKGDLHQTYSLLEVNSGNDVAFKSQPLEPAIKYNSPSARYHHKVINIHPPESIARSHSSDITSMYP